MKNTSDALVYSVIGRKVRVFLQIFAALTIATLTYSTNCLPIQLGVDPPWMYAINFLHLSHTIGTTAFAPFGPLGFILWPDPVANNIVVAVLFWLSIKFILALTFIKLFSTLKPKREPYVLALNIFFGLLFFAVFIASYGYLLIFFTVVSLLLLFNVQKNSYKFLHFAIILAVINFLISVPYSMLYFTASEIFC